MTIGWPQGIFLALIILSDGIALANHGEPKGNYNFFTSLVGTALTVSLLWWGGFFSH